ncbi:T-cell immunomodulatory protein-like protein precursor, putative [Babesia caballi]|uniref:T-cell immunomodulatory protein-like protein, putative n=1 Tax=Babesia caballi TaxID=5871 RepID=A0AAV4LTG6_BABCB|nr:T-cell immunomodulatory protein-like protein precursor, putative [Babesia caballi]
MYIPKRRWLAGLSLLMLNAVCDVYAYEIKRLSHTFAYKGHITDLGDYDGNGQLDAITYYIENNVATICVFTIPSSSDKREPLATIDLLANVDGVVGVDMNADGALDVLVIVKEASNKFRLLAYYQDKKTRLLVTGWNSIKEVDLNSLDEAKRDNLDGMENNIMQRGKYEYTSIHPLVLDINGDGLVDLLCQTEDKRLFVWANQGGTMLPFLLEHVPFCTFPGSLQGYIPSPHSSAFVDIDGDCRADLVLLVQHENQRYLQIWQADNDQNRMKYFHDVKNDILLPKNHGQVYFADLNGDGTIDIAVPYCIEVDNEGICTQGSHVAMSFNQQKPFCSHIWNNPNSSVCRKATELCSRSEFEFKALHENPPVAISLPSNYRLNWRESHTVTLSFGDLNNNGYPDLIVLVYDSNKSQPVVMVYKNVESNEASQIYTRAFELSTTIPVDGTHVHGIRVAAIDLFENGITEISIFASKDNKFHQSIATFYTTVNESIGLFMKTMVKGVSEGETPSYVNILPVGSNVNGPIFKITVIDVYGAKSPRCSVIRAQSAHSPLLPPYSMFGLGKTNNYVEEFYLGMPSKASNYSNMWISIIPNCSVIAIPHRIFYPNE